METKSRQRETSFAPGTSRKRESGITFRIQMARDKTDLLEMGKRIAELRASTGLKQQYIADQCGVTLRTYQFWQQGKNPPEQENLEKLAELFGVTPKYILKGHAPDPFSAGELSASRLGDLLGQLGEISQRLTRLEDAVKQQAFAASTREMAIERQLHEVAQAIAQFQPPQRP